MAPRTLYDKLWDSHVVRAEPTARRSLYIDRHLVHEVTSPQAYEGLQARRPQAWRVGSIVATADHNTPTQRLGRRASRDPISRMQVETLDANIRATRRQGLFPVPRPAPGHRPRHRARAGRDAARHDRRLRRFAHEHARRVRLRSRSASAPPKSSTCWRRSACITKSEDRCWSASTARSPLGVTAKDIVLAIIGKIGTAGGTGHAIEFAGSAIRALSMEGADDGVQHVDRGGRPRRHDRGRRHDDRLPRAAGRSRPSGETVGPRGRALAHARERRRARRSTRVVALDASTVAPQVTWGTSPEMVTYRSTAACRIRTRKGCGAPRAASSARSTYMGLTPNTRDHRHRASTRCSSARAPTRASRICAPPRVVARAAVARQVGEARDGRPGLGTREGAGRARRARPRISRRRLRMARAGLLDVPRDERRPARARRALRVDVEPQFRRPPGRRRPHASRQPGDGGRGGDRRAFRRRAPARSDCVKESMTMPKRLAMLIALSLGRAGARGLQYDRRCRQGREGRRRRSREGGDKNEDTTEPSWNRSRVLTGLVAPLDRANVDTDAIIPKQFLKSIKRSGFGPNLFDAWRYLDRGEPGMDHASAPPQSGLRAERAALPGRADPARARATSAAAARASTRRGRSPTTASARSSRRRTPTSSSTTATRTACCRSCCRSRRSTGCSTTAQAFPGFKLDDRPRAADAWRRPTAR